MTLWQQQSLDFPIPPQYCTFDHFIASPNQTLLNTLKNVHPLHYGFRGSHLIWAANGHGKTHILRAYSAYWQKRGVLNHYQALKIHPQDIFTLVDRLPKDELVFILDDIDTLAGQPHHERSFYELFNRAVQCDKMLLLSASRCPHEINWTLPDIRSRLHLLQINHLLPACAKDAMTSLRAYAQQLDLKINDHLLRFIHHHFVRDAAFLRQLLERAHRLSLQRQRPIDYRLLREAATTIRLRYLQCL